MRRSDPFLFALAGALGVLIHAGTPAEAQTLHNPCPYTNDGDCDEPNGLNLCAWGTDTADCSNPNSNFGGGTGYGGGASPNPAAAGASCPWTNDGDCDEPNGLGLCAWGTDTADCSNPNSNYGSGSGYRPGSSVPGGHAGATVPQTQAPGSPSTFSAWTRITNDQRQFSAQPGGVMPLQVWNAMSFEPGAYVIYHGITDGSGSQSPIWNIQSHQVTLSPDTRYVARASSMGFESFQSGGGSLIMYREPERGRAMIYVRNDDIANWRAICVLPVGMPQSTCDMVRY